jgi:acetolactate synthase-1/3 small subunit
MDKVTRHTIAILVDNETGVLSQVSRLFSRKGYNIESLAVGTTDSSHISRITIEVLADDKHVGLICNQLRKLLPVHSVKLLELSQSIRRELVLIKVRADTREARNEVIQVVNIFRGSVIDVCAETLTVSLIGAEEKTEAVETLLQEFGIVELVRTGMIALERGRYAIDENTKEKGEFNHGKHVL